MNLSLMGLGPKEIANIVRELRENRDWTQERLAIEISRSLRTIVRVEAGQHPVYQRTRLKLERVLGEIDE